jgi:hypothetical protein
MREHGTPEISMRAKTTMSNTSNDLTPRTVEDVIEYLYDALSNMRTYPLEDDFQVGYERAFNDVMYHLLASSKSEQLACSAANP